MGDSEKFTSCAHPPLDAEKIDGTRWLLLGSTSHQALQSIVLNKTLIKALDQMTKANHTGALEVYHSLLLKYCEKRNHISREGMIARTALATLDTTTMWKDSRQRLRLEILGTKLSIQREGRTGWLSQSQRSKAIYDYIDAILTKVVEARHNDMTIPTEELQPSSQLPPSIADVPRPPKQDVISKHHTRFSLK